MTGDSFSCQSKFTLMSGSGWVWFERGPQSAVLLLFLFSFVFDSTSSLSSLLSSLLSSSSSSYYCPSALHCFLCLLLCFVILVFFMPWLSISLLCDLHLFFVFLVNLIFLLGIPLLSKHFPLSSSLTSLGEF